MMKNEEPDTPWILDLAKIIAVSLSLTMCLIMLSVGVITTVVWLVGLTCG